MSSGSLSELERADLIAKLRPPRRALTEREASAFQAARHAVFEPRDVHGAADKELPVYDEQRIFFRAGLEFSVQEVEGLREALTGLISWIEGNVPESDASLAAVENARAALQSSAGDPSAIPTSYDRSGHDRDGDASPTQLRDAVRAAGRDAPGRIGLHGSDGRAASGESAPGGLGSPDPGGQASSDSVAHPPAVESGQDDSFIPSLAVEPPREPADDAVCRCGHTAHWHAAYVGEPEMRVPQGAGRCDYVAECGCEQFVPAEGRERARMGETEWASGEGESCAFDAAVEALERTVPERAARAVERLNASAQSSAEPPRERIADA
jgi:hypothetical protein